MRFYITLSLIFSFLIQPCAVLAIENKEIKNFEVDVKLQTKDQYQFKKVNKKYDPYLITFENKTGKTILLTSDTMLEFITQNDKEIVSESRREIYRKTRSRDIGKYYGFALPGSLIAGGIIGITFGLGIPVAIGVIILSTMPSTKASVKNADFAKDLYTARKLPLRMSPDETYQIRVLAPSKASLKSIVFTNLVFENDKSDTKYNLKLPVGVEL
ncbi:MAG: hypothetical protein WCG95_06445 [bacterium]